MRWRPDRWVVVLMLLGLTPPDGWACSDNFLLHYQYQGLGRYVADQDLAHLCLVSPEYQRRRLGAHTRVTCTDCHERLEVGIIPRKPVSRMDCTTTCLFSRLGGLGHHFRHKQVTEVINR